MGGVLATIALATAAVPGPALAKAKAAKKGKNAAGIVDSIVKFKDSVLATEQGKLGATFVAGTVAALIGKNFMSKGGSKPAVNKIELAFPGALKNKELVKKVSSTLKEKYEYGKSSLVATSLCADEVNRVLESDFGRAYDVNFHMGGLAGFPFGGVTSFGAMASHIPDGGSCLVVFGPHVGVDTTGAVGTVERRGRANGGSCCGSAIAAAGYVAGVASKEASKAGPPTEPTDAQQNFVGNMLLPYSDRLEKAADKMVELPYALFDAQKKMMMEVVKAGAGNVADGKIAVLGGIQINTPDGTSDYFKPMSFEVYDNKGTKVEDLSNTL